MSTTGAIKGKFNWRGARWALIAFALSAQIVTMQFTRAIAWTAFDFIAAAVLLIGANLIYERLARLVRPERRAIAGLCVIGVVALIWAEGAVGIFD